MDHVLTEPLTGSKLKQNIQKTQYILQRRAAHYDACFFLGESRNAAKRYKFLTKIPVRVCAESAISGEPNKLAPYCTHVIPTKNVWKTHVVDYFQDIVRGYFNTNHSAAPVIAPLPSHVCAKATELLSTLPQGKKRIGLCFLGSPNSLATWPKERFATLISQLSRDGHALYTAIPPAQSEYVESIQAIAKTSFAKFDAPLPELTAMLAQTDLLITVDTGQSHIAAAVNTPVLALGGATAVRTYPYTQKGYLLSTANSCFDCPLVEHCESNYCTGWTHSPGYIPPCMHAISAKDVYSHANILLENPKQGKHHVLLPTKQE